MDRQACTCHLASIDLELILFIIIKGVSDPKITWADTVFRKAIDYFPVDWLADPAILMVTCRTGKHERLSYHLQLARHRQQHVVHAQGYLQGQAACFQGPMIDNNVEAV